MRAAAASETFMLWGAQSDRVCLLWKRAQGGGGGTKVGVAMLYQITCKRCAVGVDTGRHSSTSMPLLQFLTHSDHL